MEDFSNYLNLINNCDLDEPLLSSTKLGQKLNQIPLAGMKAADLILLTQALNLEQLIPTKSGLHRDYRGLAELMGFNSIEIETRFKRSHNPVKGLIETYIERNLRSNSLVTVNHLLKMIETIERFDVIDDFMPSFIQLALRPPPFLLRHESIGNHGRQALECYQSNQLHHVITSVDQRLNTVTESGGPDIKASRYQRCLFYDVFVCFAPEDEDHAYRLISLLEDNGKRVATAEVLLPGYFEHDALMRLIDEKCHRVVIVITPNFLKSKECDFQTKYASEVGIKEGSPKIIPVLCEECEYDKLPRMIQVLSKIDLTNQKSYIWQLRKLLSSLDPDPNDCFIQSARVMNHNNQLKCTSYTENNFARVLPLPAQLNDITDLDEFKSHVTLVTDSSIAGASTGDTLEPIVDLIDSQNSSSMQSKFESVRDSDQKSETTQVDYCNQGIDNGAPTIRNCSSIMSQSNTSNNPKNWFRSVRRKLFGESSSRGDSFVSNTSSEAMLLSSMSMQSSE